jgi:hypothetical protein
MLRTGNGFGSKAWLSCARQEIGFITIYLCSLHRGSCDLTRRRCTRARSARRWAVLTPSSTVSAPLFSSSTPSSPPSRILRPTRGRSVRLWAALMPTSGASALPSRRSVADPSRIPSPVNVVHPMLHYALVQGFLVPPFFEISHFLK